MGSSELLVNVIILNTPVFECLYLSRQVAWVAHIGAWDCSAIKRSSKVEKPAI